MMVSDRSAYSSHSGSKAEVLTFCANSYELWIRRSQALRGEMSRWKIHTENYRLRTSRDE